MLKFWRLKYHKVHQTELIKCLHHIFEQIFTQKNWLKKCGNIVLFTKLHLFSTNVYVKFWRWIKVDEKLQPGFCSLSCTFFDKGLHFCALVSSHSVHLSKIFSLVENLQRKMQKKAREEIWKESAEKYQRGNEMDAKSLTFSTTQSWTTRAAWKSG